MNGMIIALVSFKFCVSQYGYADKEFHRHAELSLRVASETLEGARKSRFIALTELSG